MILTLRRWNSADRAGQLRADMPADGFQMRQKEEGGLGKRLKFGLDLIMGVGGRLFRIVEREFEARLIVEFGSPGDSPRPYR